MESRVLTTAHAAQGWVGGHRELTALYLGRWAMHGLPNKGRVLSARGQTLPELQPSTALCA